MKRRIRIKLLGKGCIRRVITTGEYEFHYDYGTARYTMYIGKNNDGTWKETIHAKSYKEINL